jgi:CTP:molybdopterin cytidylyltransferase MocA
MGGPNKLLLPVGGVPLVRRAAQALVGGGLSPVVVVLGREAGEVSRALRSLPVRGVRNPNWPQGMGTSIATGVSALAPETDAVAVSLGDLFALRAATVAHLAEAYEGSSRGIAVPVFRGRRGHPVIFRLGRYRDRLVTLSGDRGARALLTEAAEDVLEVVVDDPGTVQDVDTPAQYARLARRT